MRASSPGRSVARRPKVPDNSSRFGIDRYSVSRYGPGGNPDGGPANARAGEPNDARKRGDAMRVLTRAVMVAVTVAAAPGSVEGQSNEIVRVSVTVPPLVALSPVTATVAFTVTEGAEDWVESPSPVALNHAGNVTQVLEVQGYRVVRAPAGGQATPVELQARAADGSWVTLQGPVSLWTSAPGARRGTVTVAHRIRGAQGSLPPGAWEVAVEYGVRAGEEP